MILDSKLLEKAAQIAVTHHDGQFRKGEKVPYVTHPFVVALKLASYGFPDTVLATAITHDILEDTQYGEEALRDELGEDVVTMVSALSEDKTLPWEERKEKYIESVRKSSDEVKAISVADKIHNLESLLRSHALLGEAVWSHFSKGRDKQIWFNEQMLKMLKDTWGHPLVCEYEALVEKMKKSA